MTQALQPVQWRDAELVEIDELDLRTHLLGAHQGLFDTWRRCCRRLFLRKYQVPSLESSSFDLVSWRKLRLRLVNSGGVTRAFSLTF